MPIVIVLLAVVVSVVIFFVFTKPKMEEVKAETPPAEVFEPKAVPEKMAGGSTPVPSATPTPPKPVAPAKPSFGFARPLDLGKDMVRSLHAGDYARAGALATTADPTQTKTAEDVFRQLMTGMKATVGLEDQVELLGLVENKTRIAFPVTLPGMQEPVRIQLDLERDDQMGWKITHLQLPKELSSAMAAAAPPPTADTPSAAMTAPGAPAAAVPAAMAKPSLFTLEEMPDALTFGSDFVRALLKHDFVAARKFVDEKKVSAERLAGLCIVFEEGQYEFKPTKPLIITVANPEVSWVIAQVQSQKLQQATEFGLEMQRSGVDQPWKVVGMNLSEILSSFASSAAKMGVPYTPIISNPKGGESLALYFEYDQSELHPRALKQLEIVAGLLNSDPSKKLQIAGHTDAKGTDNYNLSLSQARAESVKKQLAGLGVAADQIVTTGLGKAQPLGPNQKEDGTDDPEGRSKNRRAEIYLDF
ncbi:outer membrane protein OmpA-like peptidoglycan-associated protein [Prosthecobacter fusiformis]|uniref:Outer membrane protein OmpA-like peptidoglycan-associated protein n=1 Tax=Prosthecobacter fusiformis TaxID=48464 RepID=A0A4R7SS10_9BACT|nr:OmpA family protein [Prosthecobacter fusiformis]TDU80958.1 outer membrane protein OmpA-like peptidoglycan-associated protein [Prosthecobacter fusiformis]